MPTPKCWLNVFLFCSTKVPPLNFIAILGVASASYYLVEQPILELRRRRGWGDNTKETDAFAGKSLIPHPELQENLRLYVHLGVRDLN